MAEIHQLAKVQHRLLTDEAFRSDFLADPVKAFQQEGVVLSPEAEQQLRSHVQALTKPAELPPGVTVGRVAVNEIQVSMSFIVPYPPR